MSAMRCPACQTENRDGVRFCEQCGAPLELACPACGARLPAPSRFCGQCGTPLGERATQPHLASPQAYTPRHLADRILKDRSALAGERKQVTVLFADVSGFTSLSETLDPEVVHGLINRAFELMLAEVHRYEGTVNQFLGDGLMALFGAPIAHEDHALRAAHAALAMQRALAGYRAELARSRGIDFRVRMGLNTGLVVVGAIGDNLRMDYTAVGDTTNTAARMQQLAEPGQIVVAEATERLVAPYTELRQLGTFSVKNRTQPVAAWELVATHATTTRLAARAARGLSPLVGRDDALATLERAWAAVRSGRGQVALIVGDAGIGKSRLLLEFRERLGETATWIEGDCVSFGQSVPFLPIIEMLKRNFGVQDQDGEAEIVAKIGRGLRFLASDAPEVEPYLRYLLAVDPGDARVAAMDAAQRRGRLVAAIQRLTAAGSRRRPIVLVVEDAHWIDSASEDFLKSLAEAIPGMAVLLVVTYRPVYQQPFGDRTYYWRIAPQPLEREDASRIVQATLGVSDLPNELAAIIAAKAEGNPFFLEEIGHALVETGAVRSEGGRLVLARAAATISVPETVQDVIAARLDRLEEAQKRTVQTAAVIGREFALALLRSVSELHERLEQSLAELKRVELIYEKSGFGDPEYVFRHALTQDVAYGSLLQSERRRLHAVIGAAIEELHAGRLDERAEELVHHFSRGEVWDKVARYAREAGERAANLFEDARAVAFYQTALAALAHLPLTPETARAGIQLRFAMRPPLWRAGQLDTIYERFREAEDLATRFDVAEVLDAIYGYLVQYHWAKGHPDEALVYGERCLEAAAGRDDLALRVTGLFYRAHAFQTAGRHREAVADCEALMAAVAGREHERFGLSGLPYVGAAGMAAWSLAELGDEQGALRLTDQGLAVAEAANHLYSLCAIKGNRATVLGMMGRAAEAVALAEPVVATCREKNFAGQFMLTGCTLACGYAELDRGQDAVALARESIELQERLGAWSDRSWMHYVKALGHLALGEIEQAQADVQRALELAERHGERGWEGWARYAGALVARRQGRHAAAEEALDEAQDLAEELGMMKLLERCRSAVRRNATHL
jgi:class 3 adenylate cyclase/tetratricopeptide (TPR) repeat protein